MSRCVGTYLSESESKIRERNARWLRSANGRRYLSGQAVGGDSLARERAELLDALDNARSDSLAQQLRRRDVRSVCPACDGHGVRRYPSRATWGRSVVGEQRVALDVCDGCWGSGDDQRQWQNLRLVETQRLMHARTEEELERACQLAVELFEQWEGDDKSNPPPDQNNWRRRARRCRIQLEGYERPGAKPQGGGHD